MFDIVSEMENYPAIDLKKIEVKNKYLPENIRESIILYNKALENIKSKSEDIAIIELKKTISLNPEFTEARNLLGLSYCRNNELERGKEIFKEILGTDKNSMLALKYLAELSDTSFTEKYGFVMKKKHKVKVSNENMKDTNTFKNLIKWIREALDFKKGIGYETKKLIVGLSIGIVFTLFITIPIIYVSSKSEKEVAKNIDSINTNYEKISDKYEKITKEYNKLSDKNKKITNEMDYYINAKKIADAESLYTQGKYEEAADLIVILKTYNFTGEDKNRVDTLFDNTMVKAASSTLNNGINFYYAKEYDKSLAKLKKVEVYKKDWERVVEAYYFSALCYYDQKNYEKATENFQNLISKFPDSKYSIYSNNYIKSIENIKSGEE